MKRLSALFVFILLLATAAYAQEGLKTGRQAPEFKGTDFTGKAIDLHQLLKKHKAVVLFFYRGAWCPYCNKYIQSMQDSLQLLTQKGIYVVGVTPQTDENIQKTADRHHTSFSMVHDKDYAIMKAYDVDFRVSEEQKLHCVGFVRAFALFYGQQRHLFYSRGHGEKLLRSLH